MRNATALVLLLACPTAFATPAPDTAEKAKERLEAMKKRLPEVVEGWYRRQGVMPWLPPGCTCRTELRLVRRLAPDRAKAVLLLAAYGDAGKRWEGGDVLLTVFLSFQDGCWTSERFELVGSGPAPERLARLPVALLVLAIDEAAEK
jgi:hypothetical protein